MVTRVPSVWKASMAWCWSPPTLRRRRRTSLTASGPRPRRGSITGPIWRGGQGSHNDWSQLYLTLCFQLIRSAKNPLKCEGALPSAAEVPGHGQWDAAGDRGRQRRRGDWGEAHTHWDWLKETWDKQDEHERSRCHARKNTIKWYLCLSKMSEIN